MRLHVRTCVCTSVRMHANEDLEQLGEAAPLDRRQAVPLQITHPHVRQILPQCVRACRCMEVGRWGWMGNEWVGAGGG